MYGLIHRAIRGCVQQHHGEEAWNQVRKAAEVNDSHFVSLQSFPDDIAYGLIGKACELLSLEPDAMLHSLGRYWVLTTAKEEYGPILDFGGRDLMSFLKNLDAMHEQVAISFSNLQQPSFSVSTDDDGSALLHYKSLRSGLSSFVVGLLDGLSERFEQQIDVEQVQAKATGADHDVFRISMRT